MSDLFSMEKIESWLAQAETWLREDFLVWETFAQLGAVVVALGLARLLSPAFSRALGGLKARLGDRGWVEKALAELEEQALFVLWLAIQWIAYLLASGTALGGRVIEATVSLLAAWVAIQFASALIRNPAFRRTIATLVWTVAALNVLGLLEPTMRALDSAAVTMGGFRLSIMVVVNGLVLFTVLLWTALLLSRTLERKLGASPHLSPSVKVLFGQLFKIIFVTVAVVVALAAVGVDLTAFAVFTGALGVGLGFGMQKIAANLISGVLLLTDHSIKPGDVIAINGTYGWVNFMGARYASVITRDGIEHLIPNETLITTSVENWSYSNNELRLKTPIGISYKSDVRKAMELVREAAAEVERILKDPKPVVLLRGFGDNSVDLEARIWINDPRNGVNNVRSELLLKVWDKFHEHGIEIPFPQRDIHIRSNEAGLMAGGRPDSEPA